MDNHFFTIAEGKVNEAWFNDFVIENNLQGCLKSNDGLVFLKLPKAYQVVKDVPAKWKADFTANKPYMTRKQAHEELIKPKWQAPPPVGNGS